MTWRRQREHGLTAKTRGRKKRAVDPRVQTLEQENRRLTSRLQRTEALLAFQKNFPARLVPHYLLDQKLPVRLRCDHPGGSGRLLFGDAANP